MSHLLTWKIEVYETHRQINWYAYVDAIEKTLHLDLGKCSEKEDGFCIDSAYDAFLVGISINDYINGFRA